MSLGDSVMMIVVVLVFWFITNSHIELTEERVIAAINDNGCESFFKIESAKTNIEAYKLDNL